jgi:hypothetical protein
VERHRAIPDARHSASPGCDRPGCSPCRRDSGGKGASPPPGAVAGSSAVGVA